MVSSRYKCKKCENLHQQFSASQRELLHLQAAHSRLKQVLSEKGAEVSQAIRRAETCDRELKKMKVKLDETLNLDGKTEKRRVAKHLKLIVKNRIEDDIFNHGNPSIDNTNNSDNIDGYKLTNKLSQDSEDFQRPQDDNEVKTMIAVDQTNNTESKHVDKISISKVCENSIDKVETKMHSHNNNIANEPEAVKKKSVDINIEEITRILPNSDKEPTNDIYATVNKDTKKKLKTENRNEEETVSTFM